MTERDVQRFGVAMLRTLGAHVSVTSQRRASSVSKGVPDVIVLWPGKRGVTFWEAKAPKGKLRPEQETFRDACQRAGVPYVWGDLEALKAHLRTVLKAAA